VPVLYFHTFYSSLYILQQIAVREISRQAGAKHLYRVRDRGRAGLLRNLSACMDIFVSARRRSVHRRAVIVCYRRGMFIRVHNHRRDRHYKYVKGQNRTAAVFA